MRKTFADLVEHASLGELFEAYSRTTGIGASLTDVDGKMLMSAGWHDISTRFHRVDSHEAGRSAASEAALTEGIRQDGAYTIHQCGNGLVEVAAPVIIENEHVATTHIGQFFFEKPDREHFRRQAAELGFEEQAYIEALDKVPIRSKEQAGQAALFLARMTASIGSLELANQRIQEGAAEFRESEQRFRVLVEQAVDAIFLHGLDGRFVEVNPRACENLGYTREELLSMAVGDIDATFEVYDHAKEHWDLLSPNETVSFEARHRRKDGSTFPVDVRLCLIEMHGRRLILAAVRDITDRRRAEEEKAKLEDQLRQAQKMEAVGQLAGGVAHDFNNILTAILGHVEVLIATQEGDTSLQSGLEEIRKAATRAAGLTRRLLVFSRRDVAQPRELDLNQTLLDMEKMLRRLIAAHIALQVKTAPDPLFVRIDPGQLEQVIMNLALNARDAMPHGGRLMLETALVHFDDAYVAAHPEGRLGPHVVLVVGDTGCGMAAETLQCIYEPFFTTKPAGRGTGLGLAMVYGIVKQAAGHMAVYSEPGCGTTFRIFLPAVAASSPPACADEEEDEAPTGDERILVCEDDESVSDLTVSMLRDAGYAVIAAATGHEALQAAQAAASGGEGIQLLVSDVMLPDTNGKKLSEAIEKVVPSIKTLFISGYTSNIIAHHGILDGGVELLEKPFGRSALLRRVRSLLDRERSAQR